MDPLLVNFLFSITILPAVVVGLIKWRNVAEVNRPIIFIWVLLLANETLRFIFIRLGIYSLLSYNLALIICCWLYLYQFHKWDVFAPYRSAWVTLGVASTLFWLVDHLLLPGNNFHIRTTYIRLYYSLLLVILSASCINKLIITERRSLLNNHQFIICVALMVYYTFRVLVDAFTIKGLSQDFLSNLASFNRYLVQLMYLLFLIAALWIPKKKAFILRY